jgi:transglutaminase superfamily protein
MKARTKRRIFLREAAVLLVAARLALRFIPAARLFVLVNRPPRRVDRFAADEIGWVAWAVETIAGRPWMRAAALPRALAAQMMLRRRGIASRLCLGVAREGNTLAATAWIEVGRTRILGGAEAGRFTRMAQFGGTP